MSSENQAKKYGKIQWGGHQRPLGKKASAKRIRQARKKCVPKDAT